MCTCQVVHDWGENISSVHLIHLALSGIEITSFLLCGNCFEGTATDR